MLCVRQIMAHSPCTFSRPRNRNCRKPRACLICPNTGSTTVSLASYSAQARGGKSVVCVRASTGLTDVGDFADYRCWAAQAVGVRAGRLSWVHRLSREVRPTDNLAARASAAGRSLQEDCEFDSRSTPDYSQCELKCCNVANKILLLEMAADDYITVPFSPRELVARLRG